MKFLSKTMIWTRAPQDLQLCGQTEAKADNPAAGRRPKRTTAAKADRDPRRPAANPQSRRPLPAEDLTPKPPLSACQHRLRNDGRYAGGVRSKADDERRSRRARPGCSCSKELRKSPLADEQDGVGRRSAEVAT